MAFSGSGGVRSGLTGLFSVGKWLLSLKGALSLTLLMLIFSSMGALTQSINQKSMLPFFKVLGGKLLNHDTQIYEEASRIEQDGGLKVKSSSKNFFITTWATLKSVGVLLRNLWVLYFFFVLFYWASKFIVNNSSLTLSRFIIAVLFLAVLEILAHFIIISSTITPTQPINQVNPDSDQIEPMSMSLSEKFVPFRGLAKFISVSNLVFKPIYIHTITNYSINQTPSPALNITPDVVF